MNSKIRQLGPSDLTLVPNFTNILEEGINSIRQSYEDKVQYELDESLEMFSSSEIISQLNSNNNKFRYNAYFDTKNKMNGISIEISLDSNFHPGQKVNQLVWLVSKQSSSGIGRNLLNFSVEESRKREEDYLRLIVSNQNQRAINFYEKFGFEKYPNQREDSMLRYWMKI